MSMASFRAKLLPTSPLFASFVALCVVGLLTGRLLADPNHARNAIALSVAFALVSTAWLAPRMAVYGLVSWLAVLGLLRRVVTSAGAAPSPFGDPLLIVAPVTIGVLLVIAVRAGALRSLTPLSKSVLALTVVLALSALNPMQGGLTVGLGGALLVVVPMLAFWIGRAPLLNETAMTRLLVLLGGLSLLAALYGLRQTFYGMPSWDASWIADAGYQALHVGTTVRPFGMSSSHLEYGAMLGIGILAWRALGRHPSLALPSVAAVALLAFALWLEAGRSLVVLTIAALWLTFAATRGVRIGRALATGAMLLALLPIVVSNLGTPSEEGSPVASLTSHQVEGLSEPFGSSSTAPEHFSAMLAGVKQGFTDPVGRGVGATTLSASRYGGTVATAEVDPGNVPLATGFIGLALYLAVVWFGLRAAYGLARTTGTIPAVAALGIVIVPFLHWLTGGLYAVHVLVWLMLGWVDAQRFTFNLGQNSRQTVRDYS